MVQGVSSSNNNSWVVPVARTGAVVAAAWVGSKAADKVSGLAQQRMKEQGQLQKWKTDLDRRHQEARQEGKDPSSVVVSAQPMPKPMTGQQISIRCVGAVLGGAGAYLVAKRCIGA